MRRAKQSTRRCIVIGAVAAHDRSQHVSMFALAIFGGCAEEMEFTVINDEAHAPASAADVLSSLPDCLPDGEAAARLRRAGHGAGSQRRNCGAGGLSLSEMAGGLRYERPKIISSGRQR